MPGVAEEFEYRSGVWKATLDTPNGHKLKLFVMGDADLMRSSSAPLLLQNLMGLLDEYIDKASAFARDSEYRDDIALADGMDLDSVVVDKWDEVKVWFVLRESDRMLGIRLHEGNPVDVFCDH